MFGNAFMIVPLFNNKQDDVPTYFPNSNWNKYPNGENLVDYNVKVGGYIIQLSGKFDEVHLYMRGGYMFLNKKLLII